MTIKTLKRRVMNSHSNDNHPSTSFSKLPSAGLSRFPSHVLIGEIVDPFTAPLVLKTCGKFYQRFWVVIRSKLAFQ